MFQISALKDSLLKIDRRIIWLIALVIAIIMGLSFFKQAKSIWEIFHKQPIQTTAQPSNATINNLSAAQITQWDIFGKVVQKTETLTVVATQEKPPETKLNLILRGVFTDNATEKTGAIIEGPDQKSIYVKIGEKVPGDAVLNQVKADSVILEKNGQLETLFFPKPMENTTAASSNFLPQPGYSYTESPYPYPPTEMPYPGEPYPINPNEGNIDYNQPIYQEPTPENYGGTPEMSPENPDIQQRLQELRQRIMDVQQPAAPEETETPPPANIENSANGAPTESDHSPSETPSEAE